MSNPSQVVAVAVVLLGILALSVTRLPDFWRDFRRGMAGAVATVGLLIVIFSTHIVVVGLRARAESLGTHPEVIGQLNGIVLGGIALLLLGALSFFVALGVFLWVSVAYHPARRPQFRAPVALPPQQGLNP